MKAKEENERAGLKLNIRKPKNMASGSITSWQIDGETMVDFILLVSRITVDSYCSPKIKKKIKNLFLERKAMTNLVC